MRRTLASLAITVAALIGTTRALAQDAPPAPLPHVNAPAFEMNGNDVVTPGPVVFKTSSSSSSEVDADASKAALDHVANFLAIRSFVSTMRIEAHVAGKDTAEGQRRSEQRALAVARALVARGVDCQRLIAVGFGASKPVADPAKPDAEAQNTRVQFAVAALKQHPIGGAPVDGGGKVAGDVCAKPK